MASARSAGAHPTVERLRRSLNYPEQLPIVERRDELVEAIAANQVLIVAGETGSGKSTQLPKLCVEAGRGDAGLIGHTQPRRLAARSIAERIAAETETALGDAVGYVFRFNDRVGPDTRIKVMTDGILLAEIQRDRTLSAYDTLIIDEAHERSLNIDFILGYVKQLLPRRPDLKLIITSATIDTERFAHHFGTAAIPAPVVEVSGRSYPVDVRYRPFDGPDVDEPLTQVEAVCEAVRDLSREGPGDMLVFLAGERDIRETADALGDLALPDTEIFPLFARLSSAEQHRVFQPHQGRRIVLATNVAETSVTVPGIRFVIDPGNARISRFNHRTKVQRLPIEPVSQASADQRAGRCGRVGPGICVRLYSEDDYDGRDEFTDPEIRRTNLASVILQMASLGLGDIAAFPFVEPPDARSVADGIQLLEELDALDPEHHGTRRWLTPMGRELSRLPVDPRFARMLIEAADNGALEEVAIIVAALSIQDPRERPTDAQQQADEAHRRFQDERSDFVTLINLWDHLQAERKSRSSSAFRRMCRREFLNHNRIREWWDIHRQVKQQASELGYRAPSRASGADRAEPDVIHQCLLSGLLSHIGMRDPKQRERRSGRGRPDDRRDQPGRRPDRAEFIGARHSRFAIAGGSSLTRRPPNWVMAGELVETNRMWARMVAPIDPTWAERLAPYLTKHAYTDPTWDAVHGTAHTRESVTLYGLPIVSNRRVTVASVDKALARELFIHHALVDDEWDADHAFLDRNREVLAEIGALEARTRRRDLMADRQARHDFFDRRIPEHVTSGAAFNKWWRKVKVAEPDLLRMRVEDLLDDGVDPEALSADAFPDLWRQGDIELELAYEFDLGSHVDGVSVHVPIEVLNQLDPGPFEWSVPGFRAELVSHLVRSLPKATRKALLPIAETVDAVVPLLDPGRGGLFEELRHHVGRRAGIVLPPDAFRLDRVPGHLRPTFRVINDRLEVLAEGKDLAALQELMNEQVKATLSDLVAGAGNDGVDIERRGVTRWDFGPLPAMVETPGPTHTIRAYPALVDESDSVAVRLFADETEALDAMWPGTRRLVRLQLPSPVRTFDRLLDDRIKLALVNPPVQSKAAWYNDAIDCAIDDVIAHFGGPVRSPERFDELTVETRDGLGDRLERLAAAVGEMVVTLTRIEPTIDRLVGSAVDVSARDARAHVDRLAYPGFLTGVGFERVDDVARYLRGIENRVEHLTDQPGRDLQAAADCVRVEQRHRELVDALGLTDELEDLVWQLEELRIVTFAQQLKTGAKVSATRIERALDAIARSAGLG